MIFDLSDACNYNGTQNKEWKGECFMRKLLLSVLLCSALVMGLLPAAAFAMELGNAPYGEQKNATKAANPAAQNAAAEIYVSSTGNDEQNTGTKDLPFATLAKAVDAAADGAAIYIMSDLYHERSDHGSVCSFL